MQAQPDIKKNIYFSEKHCLDFGLRVANMIAHPNGSIYGVYRTITAPNEQACFFKFNAQYDTVWQKKYGGSKNDEINFIRILPNNNMLLAGLTESNDGDVPYGQANAAADIWIVEVDTNGVIQKGRILRGTHSSDVRDVIVSSDGNIYMGGYTAADQYDFAHPSYGWPDLDSWYAKLDTAFNLKWIKFFSGNNEDVTQTIQEINPNRIMLSVATASSDTVVCGSQAKGSLDNMVVIIDSNGNTIWKKRYGGSDIDYGMKGAVNPITKQLYISGYTNSYDGDITYKTSQNANVANNWILVLDTLGNILGSKAYGDVYSQANNGTSAQDAIWYQDKFWTFCNTNGEGGDVDTNSQFNVSNIWIGLIDEQANLIGKYTINGFGKEEILNVFMKDGGLYLNGYSSAHPNTNTFSCDTISQFGFVLKLGQAPLDLENHVQSKPSLFSIAPNPSSSSITVICSTILQQETFDIRISDSKGKMLFAKKQLKNLTQYAIPCNSWPVGQYQVSITTSKGHNQTTTFLNQ